VLVHKKVADRFIDEIGKAITEFYGSDARTSDSYGRVVSDRHFARLSSLMSGGKVAIGGQTVADDRYIAPTVLVDVDVESQLMQEEIFGPLLPVISIDSIGDAVEFISSRPHPLALYVFAENKTVVDHVLANTTAGGVTVNGTIMHISNPSLPFGGVGESGMGAYHGKSSVRQFQHMKPVLSRGTKIDPSLAYPPYTEKKIKLFRKLL
jgi:acyl-CoA reductase-like NAD-dependent aldehyde dehydrogenase